MAVDFFLKLTDIEGESTDVKHKDELIIESFSWGLMHPADDRVSVHDFNFMHFVDKASPVLMLSCATGKHIDEAVLTARKAEQEAVGVPHHQARGRRRHGFSARRVGRRHSPGGVGQSQLRGDRVHVHDAKADGSAGEEISRGFNVKDVKDR